MMSSERALGMASLTLVTERTLLQGAVALGAAVLVSAGLIGIFGGPELFNLAGAADGDSQLRYLSGLVLGIGIAFWTLIPTIERHPESFRVLTAIVFVGGCARLFGVASSGISEGGIWLALIMELFVTPIICIWQNRVAARAQAT
jgi:hypothetical protein